VSRGTRSPVPQVLAGVLGRTLPAVNNLLTPYCTGRHRSPAVGQI